MSTDSYGIVIQPRTDGIHVTASAAEKRWHSAKTKELALYQTARHEAWVMGLSCDETTRYLQPHKARYQQFMATRPAYSAHMDDVTPPSPGSGSVATSQIGDVQPQCCVVVVDALDEATDEIRYHNCRKSCVRCSVIPTYGQVVMA